MALSKKDLQINITVNELYNTHSLLLQHIDTLVSLLHCLLSSPLAPKYASPSPRMKSSIFAS